MYPTIYQIKSCINPLDIDLFHKNKNKNTNNLNVTNKFKNSPYCNCNFYKQKFKLFLAFSYFLLYSSLFKNLLQL